MKKKLMFLLMILILISGCSSLPGGSNVDNSPKDIDTSGRGLEVVFKIDTKYIETQKLIYELRLKNSGTNMISLSRENLRLGTSFLIDGKDVFTQESIEEFYNKLFQKGNLNLYFDQQVIVSGVLVIDDAYFNDNTKTSLGYILDVNYNYKTVFDNNLELRQNHGIFNLILRDRVSQSAPLQINSISLEPGFKNLEYVLRYHFNDKGRDTSKTAVFINNLEINFRDASIISNCKPVYKENLQKTNNADINKFSIISGDDLSVECNIVIDEKNSFTTKTHGSFEYEYRIRKEGNVNIPKKN